MTDTDKEVARLLEVRDEEEQEEQTLEEVIAENGGELVSKTSSVELEIAEKLQLENIGLQQALAQEKLIGTQHRLELLAASIKSRLRLPPEARLAFDPQNFNNVRIEIPSNGAGD